MGARLLIPNLASLDLFALLLAAGAMVAIFYFKVGMLKVLGVLATLVSFYLPNRLSNLLAAT